MRSKVNRLLLGTALLVLSGYSAADTYDSVSGRVDRSAVKNVVLVHGAFTDGSGWKPVADILEHDGYPVYSPIQTPPSALMDASDTGNQKVKRRNDDRAIG